MNEQGNQSRPTSNVEEPPFLFKLRRRIERHAKWESPIKESDDKHGSPLNPLHDAP